MSHKLFEPIEIGKVTIKNRIAMAPIGNLGLATHDGCFSQRAVEYFVERAKGGTGLIITGVTMVGNDIEKIKPGIVPVVSLNPARFIQTAGEMTERVHAYGSKIFLQLGIGLGRVASPHMLECQPVAPSAIPNYWDPTVTCRELTTKEVETLVKKTAMAAYIAAEAGFDGVEIHAVHEGYLLDQFTIALFNKRTDKYGGDLMGRLRFPIEIVKAIKKTVGQDFPVQLRYSVKSFIKDWNQGGLPGESFKEKGRDVEEGLTVAKILEKAGYDSFNADGGSYDAWYWAHPPVYQEHGCYLPLTEKLKQVVSVPVLVAGRMGLPELAIKTVEEGKAADMIVIGRSLLADPHWPNKVRAGKYQDIRPCIGCHDGCLGRAFNGRPLSCAVNPACGREREYAIEPAALRKKVLVVGGGVAGMEAARVAAIRGHNVKLYEKTDKLGGHVLEASVPEFKKDDKRLLEWYETQLKKLGVEVTMNTEVTPEMVEKESPDVVILATGSVPIKPNVPGIDDEKVVEVTDLLRNQKPTGEKVVVVGGGLSGCEVALWLSKQGKQVTIVEMLDDIIKAGDPICHANATMLKDLLVYNKVKIMTNTVLSEVTDKGVVVIDKSFAKQEIPADTVVIAVGLKAKSELYDALADKYTDIYLIGDAREPKKIMDAIWNAYEVARNI